MAKLAALTLGLIVSSAASASLSIPGIINHSIKSADNALAKAGVTDIQDEVIDEKEKTHPVDKSGKSKITLVEFKFNTGDFIEIACVDWSKELPYNDKFYILIMTKKMQDWLNKESNY